MELVQTQVTLREVLHPRQGEKVLSLIPTMGNLHQGHLKLMQAAIDQGSFTVVTIFVNPMQFGPNEDFEKYPRMLDSDTWLIKRMGMDVLFAPSMEEMYPEGQEAHTQVTVPVPCQTLCGAT